MPTQSKFYIRDAAPPSAPTSGKKSSALPVGSLVDNTTSRAELSLDDAAGSSEKTRTANTLAQTARQDVCLLRATYVLPLEAQTFGSGNWNFFLEVGESASATNAFTSGSIYVWRPGTSSVVGYIIDADQKDASEWSATAVAGDQWQNVSGSNVTCQAGDLLVVEIWVQCTQGNPNSRTLTLAYDGTTDVINATNAASAASYITAPAAISFQSPAISKSGGFASAASSGGARAVSNAKSGGILSPKVTGAARTVIHAKGGGISSAASLGGPGLKSVQVSKSGGISDALASGGSKAILRSFSVVGGISNALSVGASRLVSHSKSNGIASSLITGASRLVRSAKSNGIVSSAVVGAARAAAHFKEGGISSEAELGGSASFIQSVDKAGGISSEAILGGVNGSSTDFLKDGGISSSVATGADKTVTYIKSGGISSSASLGGSGVGTILLSKFGGISTASSAGASRTIDAQKAGGILSQILLGASASVTGVIDKLGGFISQAVLGASKALIASKAGGTQSQAILGGTAALRAFRTGGISSSASLGGSKAVLYTFTVSGGLRASSSIGASQTVISSKSGGLTNLLRLGDASKTFEMTGGIFSEMTLGGIKRIPPVPGDDHSLVGARTSIRLVSAGEESKLLSTTEEEAWLKLISSE